MSNSLTSKEIGDFGTKITGHFGHPATPSASQNFAR